MPEEIVNTFPFLATTGGHKTSDPDPEYNCIAYAVGKQDDWWWPVSVDGRGFWPIALRECTLDCFVQMFAHYDYEVCSHRELEEGFEKVAVYVGYNGKPTHAARQLENGIWASKLGDEHDIEHNSLEGVQGLVYGTVAVILKRPRP